MKRTRIESVGVLTLALLCFANLSMQRVNANAADEPACSDFSIPMDCGTVQELQFVFENMTTPVPSPGYYIIQVNQPENTAAVTASTCSFETNGTAIITGYNICPSNTTEPTADSVVDSSCSSVSGDIDAVTATMDGSGNIYFMVEVNYAHGSYSEGDIVVIEVGLTCTASTDAPTVAPSDAPTSAPTLIPTSTPTAAPTDAPTHAPTTHSPTLAPTFAPTQSPTLPPGPTAAPTLAPTAAPTPTPITHLQFNSSLTMTMDGQIDASAASVLEDTIGDIIDVPSNDVTVPLDDDLTRLRARRLAASERDVIFFVDTVVEDGTDPLTVYTAAKGALETSIDDGTFDTQLNTNANAANVDSLKTATATSIDVGEPVVVKAPAPSPTPAPTMNNNNDDDDSGVMLKGTTLIIVIVVCVAVPVLLVIGSVAYIKFGNDGSPANGNSNRKSEKAPQRGLDLRALSVHALTGERGRPSNIADDIGDDLLVVQQSPSQRAVKK